MSSSSQGDAVIGVNDFTEKSVKPRREVNWCESSFLIHPNLTLRKYATPLVIMPTLPVVRYLAYKYAPKYAKRIFLGFIVAFSIHGTYLIVCVSFSPSYYDPTP